MDKSRQSLPNLADLQQFILVAEARSFSVAARQLQQTTASISLAIKRLESTLGARLFERSTRSVRLTDEGTSFYQTAINMLDLFEQGTETLAHHRHRATGNLTLSAPTDLTRTLLSSWLQDFLSLHPDLTVTLNVSDRLADLVSEPIHLAVRYGLPEDSNLIARPLSDCRRVLCGAPSYFANHPPPEHPSDLRHHNCLTYQLREKADNIWVFHRQQERFAVAVSGKMSTDDSGLARQWAVNGEGLVYKSYLDLKHDIDSGALIPTLTDYLGSASPLYLIYPSARHPVRRVTLLIEFLIERFGTLSSKLPPTTG